MRTQSDLCYKTLSLSEVYRLIQEHLPKYLNLIEHKGFYRYTAASENNSKNCMCVSYLTSIMGQNKASIGK